MNLEPFFIPYTSISSRCSIDLNVRTESVKLLENYIREIIHGFGSVKVFLGITPRGHIARGGIKENLTSSKLETFICQRIRLRQCKNNRI